MILIGLSGKKQSGKSTVANYLKDGGFVELSFATPLKKSCCYLFNLTEEQVNGTEAQKEAVIPEWGMSARRILQVVGTDLFRKQIADDFWVRFASREIEAIIIPNPDVKIVFSDVRFPNEIEAIRKLGGVGVRVNRLGRPVLETDNHPSETALDNFKFDHELNAKDKDLKGLLWSARRLIETLGEK